MGFNNSSGELCKTGPFSVILHRFSLISFDAYTEIRLENNVICGSLNQWLIELGNSNITNWHVASESKLNFE